MPKPRTEADSNPSPLSGAFSEFNGELSIRFQMAYDYPVLFVRNIWSPDHPVIREQLIRGSDLSPHPFVVFLDSGLAAASPDLLDDIREYADAHADTVKLIADPVLVPGGEAIKNDPVGFQAILRFLLTHGLCRHSTVVAMGGGAVLDAVGMAASLAHRGLRLIRLPTTVLAQDDAGIGVKNGMNAWGGKNAIGTFAPPHAVINDLHCLRTLPPRHWIAGVSEAFKVAMLKDEGFIRSLCRDASLLRQRDEAAMERLVRQCARLHLEHIAAGGDPFEHGAARPLDFGHWSAHQIEILSNYRVTHGEAVAVGIALDSLYAARQGWLAESDLQELHTGLRACGLPIYLPELDLRDPAGDRLVFEGLRAFREHLGGRLSVTFPDGIGRRREESDLDRGVMNDCINDLAGLQ